MINPETVKTITTPINHDKCVKLIHALYKLADRDAPHINYVGNPSLLPSPYDIKKRLLPRQIISNFLGYNWYNSSKQFAEYQHFINFTRNQLKHLQWSEVTYINLHCIENHKNKTFAKCLLNNMFIFVACYTHIWVCEKPISVHLKEVNEEIVLHHDTKPVIEYADGFKIYALNDIAVDGYFVTTQAHEINVDKVLAIDNAEARKEVIKKIGIERLKDKGIVIDKSGDYELIDLGVLFPARWDDSNPYCPYLLMRNPSIGVFHLEGVHPNCKTVQQAINWRASEVIEQNRDWKPSVLT